MIKQKILKENSSSCEATRRRKTPLIIRLFKKVLLSSFFYLFILTNKLIQLDPVIWCQTKLFLIHRAAGHQPAQPTDNAIVRENFKQRQLPLLKELQTAVYLCSSTRGGSDL